MFSKVNSGGLHGIEGYLVQVEADVSEGLPGFQMVGYLASEVREAEERVRTALRNSGFRLPPKKTTVNLSPANVRKEGTAYDLPIAVAILAANGIIDTAYLEKIAFVGELGLDGSIKPVRGILSIAMALGKEGITHCFLAEENVAEGMASGSVSVVKVKHLQELVAFLQKPDKLPSPEETKTGFFPKTTEASYAYDFRDVNGQMLIRRATEIAVAGRHNILYIGPPGSGKSMIAQRIPSIMPSLSKEEQLEISKIYSICGMLSAKKPLMDTRPFRAPHHTISAQALTGGGRIPKPGEISLASRGVLFLDELPEFQKKTLELLRQPLEEHQVTIARMYGSFVFPAHFVLAAAMNPCPCGFYPDRNRCHCTDHQIRNYLGKISHALLDRIDICVEASPVTYGELRSSEANESSETIRKRVERVRQIQKERFHGTNIFFNSEMGNREIRAYCRLEKEDDLFLQSVFQKMKLSARGCHKVLKVARTIADLEGDEQIRRTHLCEAISYRDLEEKYWGERI